MNIHPAQPAFASDFAQAGQHAVLDATAEHAAAQQEGINLERGFVQLINHKASQAIISEAIADGHREDLRRVEKFLDVRFRTPASGAIELVRALGELGNARELSG